LSGGTVTEILSSRTIAKLKGILMSATASGGDTTPKEASTKETSTNIFDVLMALVVCGALVVLVLVLIDKYDGDTEKVTSILGVAAPVLAAAFGVSLGYYSGNKAGEANGKKKGKAEVKQQSSTALQELEAQVEAVLTPITRGLESPSGQAEFIVGPGSQGFRLPTRDIAAVREAVGELRGVLGSQS